MTQSDWTDAQTKAGASEGAFSQEKRAAEGLIDDVRTAASDAGSQAKAMAAEKAEELQGAAASHLHHFADAVRTAGDELAERHPGPVSDLVRQAAAGLEQFSGVLGRKSSAEMIDRVRDFGRQNPVGFLAGSMLAGFALARFAGSAAPQADHGSSDRDEPPARTGRSHGAYTAAGDDWNADLQDTSPEAGFDAAEDGGFRAEHREGEDASGAAAGTWRTEV